MSSKICAVSAPASASSKRESPESAPILPATSTADAAVPLATMAPCAGGPGLPVPGTLQTASAPVPHRST
jgi:hypothetical protein